MPVDKHLGLIVKLLGVDPSQEWLVYRIIGVLIMYASIVLLWLAALGAVYSPWVRAGDLQKVVAQQQVNTNLLLTNLKQLKSREIREVLVKLCGDLSAEEREAKLKELDRLQDEYKALNDDKKYEEPTCERLL